MRKKDFEKCYQICCEEIKQRDNEPGSFYHWSFLFHSGEGLVAQGINSRKTHPIAAKYGHRYANVHSELAAFLALDNKKKNYEYLANCEMLNIRINSQFVIRPSKPCPCCHAFLLGSGISEVHHTEDRLYGWKTEIL
jgi:deoxycytidylate deaminase